MVLVHCVKTMDVNSATVTLTHISQVQCCKNIKLNSRLGSYHLSTICFVFYSYRNPYVQHSNCDTAHTFVKLCSKPNGKGILNMKCMSHLSQLPGYEVDNLNLGFNSQQGQKIFLSQTCSNWLRGPPSLSFNGYWNSFLRDKVSSV